MSSRIPSVRLSDCSGPRTRLHQPCLRTEPLALSGRLPSSHGIVLTVSTTWKPVQHPFDQPRHANRCKSFTLRATTFAVDPQDEVLHDKMHLVPTPTDLSGVPLRDLPRHLHVLQWLRSIRHRLQSRPRTMQPPLPSKCFLLCPHRDASSPTWIHANDSQHTFSIPLNLDTLLTSALTPGPQPSHPYKTLTRTRIRSRETSPPVACQPATCLRSRVPARIMRDRTRT